MIDRVPLEAHGALIYALSGYLLMIVDIVADQQYSVPNGSSFDDYPLPFGQQCEHVRTIG
jgi:hypothetical protein